MDSVVRLIRGLLSPIVFCGRRGLTRIAYPERVTVSLAVMPISPSSRSKAVNASATWNGYKAPLAVAMEPDLRCPTGRSFSFFTCPSLFVGFRCPGQRDASLLGHSRHLTAV